MRKMVPDQKTPMRPLSESFLQSSKVGLRQRPATVHDVQYVEAWRLSCLPAKPHKRNRHRESRSSRSQTSNLFQTYEGVSKRVTNNPREMKNAKTMFSSKTPEWATPQALYDELNAEFNFTLDPCATKENAKCSKFYTKEDDGLSKNWDAERVFCNPPYGAYTPHWVKKAAEAKNGIVVMLIPARTDTRYFHEHIWKKAEIRFIKGRIKFEGAQVGSGAAPFPSMVVVFNNYL